MFEFFVHGIPAPQGSKKMAKVRGKDGRGRMILLEVSRRVLPWRAVVAASAVAAKAPMHDGWCEVRIVCRWVRPATHYKADGTLRKSAASRPGYADSDKLARAIFDAMAGIVYRNDRQVARHSVERRWCNSGEAPGAEIQVIPMD